MSTPIKHLVTLLATMTCLGACGGDDPEPEVSTVQGRLTQEDAAKADTPAAESVVVSRVEADGSLTSIASAQVGAQGTYRVELPQQKLSGRQDVVIQAMDSAQARVSSVAISRDFTTDGVYTAAPMDRESDAEAQIIVLAKTSGSWCTHCTIPLYRVAVDATLAARLKNDAAHERAAASIATGFLAQQKMWEARAEQVSDAEREQARSALASAQLTLDAKLHASSSASASQSARASYASAQTSAYASIDKESSARAFTAYAQGVERSSEALDSSARAALLARAEMSRAVYVDAATRVAIEGKASPDYEQATRALLASLGASAQSDAMASADIKAAYKAWQASAKQELNAQFAAPTQLAVDGLLTSLDAANGVYFGVVAGVNGSGEAAAETLVQAQQAFHNAYRADANVTVLTATGVEQERAKTYLDARAHVAATAHSEP